MNERDAWDDERLAERVREAYRQTPSAEPAARERLDRALERMPAPRRGWSLRWLTEPSALSVRPAAAVLAALLLLAAGALLGRGISHRPATRSASGTEAESIRSERGPEAGVVQFVFVAPRASRVAVVGDFNGWDATATPMSRPSGSESWTARVTVPAGRHVYAFVMDGTRWISDPQAPLAPANEFGFRNSIVLVGEAGAS